MHLFKIFKPNPREIILEEENKLLFDDTTSVTLDISIRLFTIKEVRAVIKNKKKASSYDWLSHNQSNTADTVRNGNKIHHPIL